MKYIRFPARTFEVAPNPGLLNTANANQSSKFDSIPWGKWLAIVAGTLAIAFVSHRYLLPAFARWREQIKDSEPAAFQELQHACQSGDATAVSHSFRKWLGYLDIPLEQYISASNSPFLLDQITLLNEKLYSNSSVKSWSPHTFSKELARARKNFIRRRNQKTSASQPLAFLNPQ